MVAGHLQEKKGYYYIVLSYRDRRNKRKQKWIATGLLTKGNKKKAERMIAEVRKTYVPSDLPLEKDILFSAFLEQWLEIVKSTLRAVTYSSYSIMLRSVVIPYFEGLGISLRDLQAKDIQYFYMVQLKRVKASTVLHYHANIHKALKYAVRMDLIPVNPADKVERPRMDRFVGSFYDSDEMTQLLERVKGHRLELPVLFGAFYGLRRSEVIGLRWSSIDFANNTLKVNHTVSSCRVDGKNVTVVSDTMKNKSSMRTLPLVPAFKEKLLAVKAQQEKNRKLCGRSYSKKYLDYVCVNELGELMKPDYISQAFPDFLVENGIRKIRFHDLRHSCASLLLANGVSMKQIQEWLGHSDFATTANIYAHLDYSSKLSSAQAMVDCLKLG